MEVLRLADEFVSATAVNNMDATEIRDAAAVQRVAKLLQADSRHLVNALTTRTITTKEENVVSSMTAEQALDVRDAFVKGIYGKLFIWIVQKINSAIYKFVCITVRELRECGPGKFLSDQRRMA